MDRQESAEIFRDVVIYHKRNDVPANVIEAMDVAMQIFGREPRMEREKEARATQLENALRALLDTIDRADYGEVSRAVEQAADEARTLLDGDSAPTDTEDPDA